MGSLSALPALDVKTPQQPNLLDQFSQLQQLKGNQQAMQQRAALAPLQQEAAQQNVQTGQLDIQQKQQQLKNQQALTQAYQTWDGRSYEDLAHLALKAGATGDAIQAIQQHGLALRKTASDIAESDAKTGSDNATTLGKQLDQAAGALQGVLSAPPEQQGQALIATAQQLAQQKRPDGTPLLDAQHLQMAEQLAQQGPQAIATQVPIFAKSLTALSAQLESAQKQATTQKDLATASATRGKIDPTSPFYAPTAQSVAMGTAPGAAQIQAGEAKQAGAKAGSEAAARFPYEMRLAAQKQALSQGDPNAAGQLLANHDATLSELKSRGATPDFIAKSLFAAKRLNPSFNPQEDEAQFAVAKSPANTAFFGSANSLIAKGGTLDQLAEAAKEIPQNQIPVFNTVEDAMKAATGNGPIAKYASLLVGVADDYSKVMGGGTGSDASRAQGFKLAAASASPAQRTGSIEGIRGAVGSQTRERIGKNPILQRMYGTQQAATPSGSGVGDFIMQGGHKFKVTARDANGKVTAADPVQ